MKKLLFRKISKDTMIIFVFLILTIGIIVWTLQAVNYLDYVTKDGHGIKTYLLFSLSNFPKIIHRLVPFIFFIALFFTLINYELKNELLIFWINGVSKIKFINHIIYISIVLMIIQLSLGSFFSPYFQFKGRMFLKESKIDFFTSLISEGKFLSVMDGLTIFIESQNYDGSFNNIFIDDSSKVNKKMIYAKYGILVEDFNIKKFKLYNGEISNMERNKINNFEFEQIDFNLTNFNSSTILVPKIQELSSKNLLKCLINLEFKKKLILNNKNINCEKNIYNEIRQELFKRFYKPLYIPLIALASCYLLLTSKMKFSYNKLRNIIFLIVFFIIVLSEISLRYSTKTIFLTKLYMALPFLLFLIFYIFLLRKIKNV